MPISITTDLTDVNLSEATTNYAVIGTWATAIAASPDTYVQSSNTVGGRVSASTAWAHTTIPTTTVDLTINQRHVFQWLKSISIPQLDSKANGGLGVTISSDATPTLTGTTPSNGPTNSKTWYLAGNADALSGWVCYVVDPTSTPDLTLGSPVVTSIQRIGVRGKVVGTVGGGVVRPINVTFDATRYGTGLTYQGDASGTPGTLDDILSTAMDPTNAWGILTADSSIYFGSGKFNFGTAVQSSTSSFKETGKTLVWRNFPVATTFYEWYIVGASAYSTTFQLGNYSGGLVSDGLVIKGAGDPSSSTHAVWNINISTYTTVYFYGSQISELRRATLQSTTSVRGCTFKNFGDITVNGALFNDCTFQDLKTTAPISAIYGLNITTSSTVTNCKFINCATAIFWNTNTDTNSKLDNTSFVSGGTGHAIELGPNTPIEITLTSVTFSSYGANGTTNAAIYNNSGKSITINITGGTSPTYRNGTGASTTIVASVPVSITVVDVTNTPIATAQVAIYKTSDNTQLVNTATDVNGQVSFGFGGTTPAAIYIRVRKSSTGATKYIPVSSSGSITSTGFSATITLIQDTTATT